MHALDPGVLERPRPPGRHVADRGAALEVRVLGHEPRALQHPFEVALREPLALRDQAEAVRAGRLGRTRVLEDLVGLHHRVHRRLGLRVARLGTESAVLGAPARLRVDQRAHVGGVAEALLPRPPGPLHQRLDVRGIAEAAESEGLLPRDQRRHGPAAYAPPRTARNRNRLACR